jgi:Fur family transcriptional regulator, zinc uptake regulator
MSQQAEQVKTSMGGCDHNDESLTRNEKLVVDVLSREDGPMKAYELLAALKDKGVKAPMTVYRALDRLEAKGLVHKLDGINAFVICNHDEPHRVQIFLICTNCSHVEEVREHDVDNLDWNTISKLGDPIGFKAEATRIEVRGTCAKCQET